MTASEYLQQIQANRRTMLYQIVKAAGRPQKAIADKIGVTRQQLTGLLSGKYDVCEYRARLIEQKLGMEWGTMDLPVATELHRAHARVLEPSNA